MVTAPMTPEAAQSRARLPLAARLTSPRGKTILLSAGLAVVAVILAVRSAADAGAPALTVTFFLAEQYLVNVEFRRQTHSLTFAGVPLAVGILMLPVHELLIARVIGSVVALAVQRVTSEKFAYNIAAYAFEGAIVTSVVHLVLPQMSTLTLGSVAGLVGLVAVGDQVMSLLVLWVISVHGATLTKTEVAEVLVPSLILSATTSVFAVAVGLLIREGIVGWLPVAMLVGVAIAIYASFARTKRRHQSLKVVHEFVARGVGAETVEALARDSLSHIRRMLRAAHAELIVVPDGPSDREPGRLAGPRCVRLRIAEDDALTVDEVELDAGDWLRSKALYHAAPTVADRTSRDAAIQRWLRDEGAQDAVVVPLIAGSAALAVMTVTDRLGDTATFTHDDLALLETLSSHLAMAIRSARLVERLGHAAMHDALTGLANRTYLHEAIAAAIDEDATQTAVLILDLDKFKDVNDVLGHDVGDRLLMVVGERLVAALPESAVIARLGGDEFSVLLRGLGPDPAAAAEAHARAAAAALSQPVSFDEAMLAPEASIGIALGNGTSPNDLLRRADTAMYAAKACDDVVALYCPELDQGRAERLALMTDLKIAASAHPEQFVVHFQPKIDLPTGRLTSAEALVRWHHPTLGVVPPGQFIPLAEMNGTVEQLTKHVLRSALRACAQWHADGLQISVAVNLSARNVTDPQVPAQVEALLAEAGVAPEHLILEITESSVVADPDDALLVLQRLADTGVRISLDDFGTGYSSLSYLQRLPVSELKIDRSFVIGLDTANAHNARALIRNIASLGSNLDMRVVAEGIETPHQLEELIELGCEVGQGFLISRPLPAAEFRSWALEKTAPSVAAASLGPRLIA
jgi:diguanylate cyclase (GGDEF)-like protein